jgi:peptidoglycan/LPS O-acetylase OafA/YrhL
MSHHAEPTGRPLNGTRLPSLTGMRFVAAALVFLHHGIWVNVFADDAVRRRYHDLFINAGHVGVSFFFILSGFVLTSAVREGDTLRRFWRRRAAKVYPNHVVTFVAALFLIAPATRLYQAVPNLLLVQSWVPRYDVIFSVNPPSWSLACEALFYLSFPLLLAGARRIRDDRLWWWAAGVVASVLAVALIGRYVIPGNPVMPDGQPIGLYQFWFVYAFPPVRALDFALGILMARIVQSGRWIRLGLLPAAALFVVAYAASMALPYVYGLGALTVAPLALLVAAAAASDLEGQRSPFRGRVMTWLGEISYAFYLVHAIVLVWARGKLGGPDRLWSTVPALGLLLLGLVISVLVAWILHAAVERPVMKRWSRPRGKPAPSEPVQAAPASLTGGTR